MSDIRKYIAECVGTMFLVFMGCGSAVLAANHVGNLGISFAFGLSVLVMVYAIGPVSGCHINPAITLAMLVFKRIKTKEAVWYMVAQFIGAAVGAAVLYGIANGTVGYNILINGLGQNGYGAVGSPGGYCVLSGALIEFVLTALFLFVIFGAIHKNTPAGFAGIAIGFALVLIHIVGIPVTGVSVNPARSFGPALINLIAGNSFPMSQLWLFILMPSLGALFGGWMHHVIYKESN
ncbi:Channel protein family [Elusimicrobium minutum Pei191]|uniref:Channel protein family n=1 Tax=Elusimicrobium minutum (strain Pei191) TaxID=445932 RepID=B2KCW8_ELUMP|nr:MIP family channel protein [Elusimicrobium minutum]ACC98364.1 Channel protein family [Elusimicrobium minutum Pei191]